MILKNTAIKHIKINAHDVMFVVEFFSYTLLFVGSFHFQEKSAYIAEYSSSTCNKFSNQFADFAKYPLLYE